MQPPKPMKPQGGALKTTDPNLAHETTDISLTGVVAFILALAFCGLVIFVVLWGVFHFATSYAAKQDELDKRDPWVQSTETQVEQAAKKLRRALTNLRMPGLASRERTRTWGTNATHVIFERVNDEGSGGTPTALAVGFISRYEVTPAPAWG